MTWKPRRCNCWRTWTSLHSLQQASLQGILSYHTLNIIEEKVYYWRLNRMTGTNLNSDVKKGNRYILFTKTPSSRNLFFFLKVSSAWVYLREDWVRGEKGLNIICVKVNQEGDNWEGLNNRGTQKMHPYICNKMYSWCLLTHFFFIAPFCFSSSTSTRQEYSIKL